MSNELGVRIGKPEDVHNMMDLAAKACEENGFTNPNPQKLLAEIWAALNLAHGIIGIIEGENGIIEGAVLLRIGPTWYSDDQVLEEKAIFIHPDYRSAKGGRARRLCEFTKQVADELGIPLIIGVLSNHRTRGKVKLYERQFGEPAGAFFLYNARTGALRQAAE
jgi:GNAT superfamily N-acetyltransferase